MLVDMVDIAYIDLDFVEEVQLIIDHIICVVFAAVAKTEHCHGNIMIHTQLATLSLYSADNTANIAYAKIAKIF